jgi:hypothetical protein
MTRGDPLFRLTAPIEPVHNKDILGIMQSEAHSLVL